MTGAIDGDRMHMERTAPAKQPAQRIDSLDLLRGICALMVAAYHYQLWSERSVPKPVDGLLAFCGTYGVSMFFVLSGFSLSHAYFKDFSETITASSISRYFRRRIGRLMPLFIAVTLFSIIGRILTGGADVSGWEAMANILLLFGFFDPAKSPVIGGWSIGIEVVFYLVLPIMVLLHKHIKTFLAASVFLTAWVTYDLARYSSLADGWSVYVAPANHFIFFAMGVAGSLMVSRSRSVSGLWLIAWTLLIIALIAVVAAGATELEVVTGWRRIVLTVISCATVFVVSAWHVHPAASKWCTLLGGLSYPMYLLHPLVFFASAPLLGPGSIWIWALWVLCAVLALVADRLFDSPTQRAVRRLGW